MASTDSLTTGLDAIATGCALVDRGEDGKLALTGTEAASFLTGQVTSDVESLEPGTGQEACLLTPKGKTLALLRILRTEDEFLLVTERASLQALFDAVRTRKIGFDVELHKRTLQMGLLSLSGPRADAVAGVDLPPQEHANARATIAGRDVLVVRTWDGIDVLPAAEDADAVGAALLENGAAAIEPEVAEVARVEAGRPRFGFELDDSVIPQEAGLNERTVSFTKGCYVGQETVARLHWRGKPNRHLRGLRLERPGEPGEPARLGDRIVAELSSPVVSPRFGPIALGLVRREAEVGDVLTLGDGTAATVVELPFTD